MPTPSENNPSSFDISQYDYQLPEKLIAQYPLEVRDKAKLMVINRRDETIVHDEFCSLGKYIPSQSLFVVNDSKVIAARLKGVKEITGASIEVFLLKQIDEFRFEALLRPLRRVGINQAIDIGHGIKAYLEDREKRIIRFNQPHLLTRLAEVGHIPLPVYIKRDDTLKDKEDYQTVYAKHLGSVASPTAGLHFTQDLINQLSAKGHQFKPLTLHIGYGTFKPVEGNDIRSHQMHTEEYLLTKETYEGIKRAKEDGKSVIAVGTTSTRVLETVANGGELSGQTNIFIYPGFNFKIVDALITNFHLPRSTLLMLVSAFMGHELMLKAYREAIKQEYRFYSYGDAMLIL